MLQVLSTFVNTARILSLFLFQLRIFCLTLMVAGTVEFGIFSFCFCGLTPVFTLTEMLLSGMCWFPIKISKPQLENVQIFFFPLLSSNKEHKKGCSRKGHFFVLASFYWINGVFGIYPRRLIEKQKIKFSDWWLHTRKRKILFCLEITSVF